MSLHAQLSPEAQERLAAQKRASTITSLIIAILIAALLVVILLFITMFSEKQVTPEIIAYQGDSTSEDKVETQKVQTQIQRKPSAPSNTATKVIVANAASSVAIPVPEIDVAPSTNFGDGSAFGDGWGDGNGAGAGGGFGNIPAALKKRCSREDRIERLLNNGGTEKCEEVVVNALRFLKETQNKKNGSWANEYQVGMTGLALLTYLGHCETAQSAEFGESVQAAITYLTNIAIKNKGKMASDFKNRHWCYEHAIGVYALGEAYTLCVKSFNENHPQLKEALQMSGQFLINNQTDTGGWEYDYAESSRRGGGDTSIVGWHLQALKACKFTGLEFKNLNSSYKKALKYMESKQASNGSFGYANDTPKENGSTLAAVGALSFQIWKSSANSRARKAVRYIDENIKFKWDSPDADLYGHYYAVQAMINHGGKEWEKYNKLFRDEVLNNQNKDGSFKVVNGGKKVKGTAASFAGNGGYGKHYRACLATLMLESYYRFLPATGSKN